MIRVAFVVPNMERKSGWHSMAKGIIQSLQGFVEPTLIASQSDAENVAQVFPSIPIVTVPCIQDMGIRAPRTWASLISTWWCIHHSKPLDVDLIHSLEAYPTGWVAQQLAQRANVPYLLSLVGTYAVVWHRFRFDRWLYSHVLRHSAYLCPISTGTLEMVRRYFGKACSRVPTQVVLLGTNTWRDIPQEDALHRFPAQPPVILSIGEVKPRKGYDVALAAFQIIQREMPDVRYKIVGSTAFMGYYQRLLKFTQQNNIHNVEFLGYISSEEELQECYREASVFF